MWMDEEKSNSSRNITSAFGMIPDVSYSAGLLCFTRVRLHVQQRDVYEGEESEASEEI